MLNARQRVNALKLLDNSTMTNILAKNLLIIHSEMHQSKIIFRIMGLS